MPKLARVTLCLEWKVLDEVDIGEVAENNYSVDTDRSIGKAS